MLVSYRWLQSALPLRHSPEEVSAILTMLGFEVEEMTRFGEEINGVVTAKILDKNKHPNAEKLSYNRVTDGTNVYNIVCGAPNISADDIVPLATVGATLPGGVTLKRSKIRGLESEGMMCSQHELGISEDHEGIMILPPDTPLGKDFKEYAGLEDTIFNIYITAGRSDCLGMLGLARELAAKLRVALHPPSLEPKQEEQDAQAASEVTSVAIEAPELCGRYIAKVIKGIKVQPSPLPMQLMLGRLGMRPINNIVDVTNLVLMEFGHPLHAFDMVQLDEQRIVVRRAQPGEIIMTLDGTERKLSPEMLVIADGKKPVAVAGVMGGGNSEVSELTENVLLESAWFNPAAVALSAQKLGMNTEASLRFIRGTNPETAELAATRAAQLMARLSGGRALKGMVDVYPRKPERVTVTLDLERVNNMLGTSLTREQIEPVFAGIEIKQEWRDSTMTLTAPVFRHDLNLPEDYVEEIARHIGYDSIPATLPVFGTEPRTHVHRVLFEKARDLLVGCGLQETVTLAFSAKEEISRTVSESTGNPACTLTREPIALMNPLSPEWSCMRTSLIPGLLRTVIENFNRGAFDLRLFESASVFLSREGQDVLPDEPSRLGIALTGHAQLRSWTDQQWRMSDFYDLKGIVELLIELLGIPGATFEPACHPTMHPGICAQLSIGGESGGWLGMVSPVIADRLGLRQEVFIAELNLDLLLMRAQPRHQYEQISRFPSVERDIAIVLPRDARAGDVLKAIRDSGGQWLKGAALFDRYQGEQIAADKQSLAFNLKLQALDHTLTDEEANGVRDTIVKRLSERFSAELR